MFFSVFSPLSTYSRPGTRTHCRATLMAVLATRAGPMDDAGAGFERDADARDAAITVRSSVYEPTNPLVQIINLQGGFTVHSLVKPHTAQVPRSDSLSGLLPAVLDTPWPSA
ncbi:hypothetical protein DFH06DRAFT_1320781 [Mycena polygramma]|nr:hypothetical protein DFH06DRAFT_1320781 [Mycena polygramma]